MSRSPALREFRIAAAITHVLPQSVLAVASPCGQRVHVGFRPNDDVSMTPCALRRAVSLAGGDADALASMLGLPGVPLRAWFVGDEMDKRHVGLGVYRHECRHDQGYVFVTLLAPAVVERTLRDAMADARSDGGPEADALEHGFVQIAHDPELETTIVLVGGYDEEDDPPPGAAGLALRFAASCAVEELVG